MQTPPLLRSLGLLALTSLYPFKTRLSSSIWRELLRKVSDKQIISNLCIALYASNSETLTKSWAEILFRFQWQKERLVHWPGPGFTSTSPQSMSKSLNAKDISKLTKENVLRQTQESCPSLMTSFVSRKKPFGQRKKNFLRLTLYYQKTPWILSITEEIITYYTK